MPIYDFYCKHCDKAFDELVLVGTQKARCRTCKKLAKKQISAHAGYQMSSGGASTRPSRAGSFKRGVK